MSENCVSFKSVLTVVNNDEKPRLLDERNLALPLGGL
jgi:hypothetical protein